MEGEANSPQRPLPNDEHFRRNCIIANLKDSLLSQLAESNPSLSIKTCRASSLIQRHLQKLFISFNTPTHPPYALMIHRAITELNGENGSTEEAISDFIQREYEDLPWAHKRILGIQLGKLCQDGELVCNDGGRYVLVVDGDIGGDGKEREEHKDRKKRTRSKKGNDHHVDRGGEKKGKVQKSCEVVKRGNELKEGGIKEQIQVHGLDSARTIEPIRVVEYAQEKGEEALNQSIERVEEQAESEKVLIEVVGIQSQSQGTGVVDQYFEAEASAHESQVQDSILHSKTIFSSKPTALNGLVDSQQPLLHPSSKSVPSKGIKLSLTQLKLQISSSLDVYGQKQDENPVSSDPKQHCRKRDRRGRPPKAKRAADNGEESLLPLHDVIVNAEKPNVNKIGKQWLSQPQGRGIGRGRRRKRLRMLKNKAILAYANVHNEQPQLGNQGSPQRNLYENPMSGDPEQSPPKKKPRGRPRKLRPVENYPGPFLSSDDGILSDKKPNINKMEKQHLYCRGRGKGTGRSRGRPPKLNRNANHYEKQLQKDQVQQHGRGRGRGRPRKLDRNTNTNLCVQHLQPQHQAEGLVSFPTLDGYDNQSLEQKQLQLQSQEEGSQQQQSQGWDQNQDLGHERPLNPEPPVAITTSM